VTRWIQLKGAQREELQKALLQLFQLQQLEQLLSFRLDVTLYNVVSPGPAVNVVFELVTLSQQQGWLDDLLLAVSEARPGHPVLEKMKTEVGLGKSVSPDEAGKLEAFVDQVGGLLDPEVFRTKLAKAEAAVCRITHPLPGSGLPYGGTGFLVGPDVVMTNYHVMKHVIKGQVQSSDVEVLFDYKEDMDGNEVNRGNKHGLAGSWLVDNSPYTQTDLEALPEVPDTAPDVLDHALIRLDEPVGCRPVPTNVPGKDASGTAQGDRPRGWIEVPEKTRILALSSPLLVLQHPKQGMMKLAWSPDSVIAVNGSGTRVRHRTATLGGSSGSPCFDADFNLVALHHAGDPAETATLPATYNQAIPVGAIVSLVTSRGIGDTFHGQCADG